MKDLYKRLGISSGASAREIREAISPPASTADTAVLKAAEFVLLDQKRRAVYDRTHRVLTTVGDLRSHLGLNFKTFWTRGKLRDFTYDLAAPEGRPARRTIRSLRPADIRRAFGLRGTEPAGDYEGARRRTLAVAFLFFAITVAAVAVLIYYAMGK